MSIEKKFQQAVFDFIEDQKGFNATVASFIEDQKGFNKTFFDFVKDQKRFNETLFGLINKQDVKIDGLDRKAGSLDKRGKNLERDIVEVKVNTKAMVVYIEKESRDQALAQADGAMLYTDDKIKAHEEIFHAVG